MAHWSSCSIESLVKTCKICQENHASMGYITCSVNDTVLLDKIYKSTYVRIQPKSGTISPVCEYCRCRIDSYEYIVEPSVKEYFVDTCEGDTLEDAPNNSVGFDPLAIDGEHRGEEVESLRNEETQEEENVPRDRSTDEVKAIEIDCSDSADDGSDTSFENDTREGDTLEDAPNNSVGFDPLAIDHEHRGEDVESLKNDETQEEENVLWDRSTHDVKAIEIDWPDSADGVSDTSFENGSSDPLALKPLLQCTVCGKLVKSISDHMKIHRTVKKYKCTFCDKSFAQSNNLSYHLQKHANEKPFQCDICDRKFYDKAHLTSHMIMHFDERSYKCSICSKLFNHKCNLNKHLRIHYGEKPYSCDVCGMSFNNITNKKIHEKRHYGKRDYACKVCSKSFYSSYHLKRHQIMHTMD